MIKFELLKKNRAVFQCFTGFNVGAFYELLPSFEQAYEADLEQRDKNCFSAYPSNTRFLKCVKKQPPLKEMASKAVN